MLDELIVGGAIQESSKKNIVRAITAQDMLQEVKGCGCGVDGCGLFATTLTC